MKRFFAVSLTLYLLLGAAPKTLDAAAVCGAVDREDTSEVHQFFKSVQCTLEKAKPWVEQIEKEAKKLEESAKKFGKGVISRLNDLMDKWTAADNRTTAAATDTEIATETLIETETATESDVTEVMEEIPAEVNEIDFSEECTAGQILDAQGKCQKIL